MSLKQYDPELGQALFGQPPQQFECPEILDAALVFIRDRLDTILWNNLQRRAESPFGNTGSKFETDGLFIEAYSWGDEEQPYNFKCGDIEVSWYKYLGRGMSVNRAVTSDDVSAMLERALEILKECDAPHFTEKKQRDFTYA